MGKKIGDGFCSTYLNTARPPYTVYVYAVALLAQCFQNADKSSWQRKRTSIRGSFRYSRVLLISVCNRRNPFERDNRDRCRFRYERKKLLPHFASRTYCSLSSPPPPPPSPPPRFSTSCFLLERKFWARKRFAPRKTAKLKAACNLNDFVFRCYSHANYLYTRQWNCNISLFIRSMIVENW